MLEKFDLENYEKKNTALHHLWPEKDGYFNSPKLGYFL